jgi:2-hydroxy-3-oxopropionate reductase
MLTHHKLGFIGLGNMGGAIALRLLRAGFDLTVFDVVREKMRPLLCEGAGEASTPAQVAERSTLLLASLQAGDVEQVALGDQGIAKGAKPGLIFVDLSSTAPELAVRLSETLRHRQIEMLDSPVSGADIGAANGNLTLFVGGTRETFQQSLPVLQIVGSMVTYLGKSGNGQLGKIINEMMQTFSQLAIYEGLQLAEKMGLDLKMFARAASAGCAQSWRLDELIDGAFDRGEKQFRLNLRPERTGRALELAQHNDVALVGAESMHRLFGERGWEVVIDFDRAKVLAPGKS